MQRQSSIPQKKPSLGKTLPCAVALLFVQRNNHPASYVRSQAVVTEQLQSQEQAAQPQHIQAPGQQSKEPCTGSRAADLYRIDTLSAPISKI